MSCTAILNISTRVYHTCDHICHVSLFYDVIIHYKRNIALSCLPITRCANAYNEDDLVGVSWHTRFCCMYHDCAYTEFAGHGYLL